MKNHVTRRGIRGKIGVAAMGILLAAMIAACGERIPERYQAFFDLPYREWRDSLLRYPIEEQLELYSIAMSVIRPPPLYFADYVAANGPTAIPAILARLRKVEDDYDRNDLIYILEMMVCVESIDVRKEPGAIAGIKEAIAAMRLDRPRDLAQAELATIADGCVTKNARAREKYEILRHADSSRK
jgi:hypothetical protein